MKTTIFALITALGLAVSCSSPIDRAYSKLDLAIDRQEYYDMKFTQAKDSLTAILKSDKSDSLRWETAYMLSTMMLYHNLDSCYQYIRAMETLSGDNLRMKSISKVSHLQFLQKTDSIGTALKAMEEITPSKLDTETFSLYCNAAYHIYLDLSGTSPEYMTKAKEILDQWWQRDSTNARCIHYSNIYTPRPDIISRLQNSPMKTLNDTAKVNDMLAREYMRQSDLEKAIIHYATAAECDMRLSAKNYNALFALAKILFKEGDIVRADRYMRTTRQDALASNYKTRYENVFTHEMEIMNMMLQQQKQKIHAYLITTIVSVLLLIFSIITVRMLSKYSSRLNASNKKLDEVSKIKEIFLAVYMEKCVDYLNKVDQYRSSLRKAVKQNGPEAAIAMLRSPSFADREFKELLTGFDSAFLSIFPDFVDKVNEHMQDGYQLKLPSQGELSTELRILALIRMGITKRPKIAKVLNISITTVYTYHCNLQRNSLHSDSTFDKVIASL
jgi:tetratricopeptide (TPR) repeat protein